MTGPCAKATVRCVITSSTGMKYWGTNACQNPQKVCPRALGEGYEKCTSVCQQQGHAEVQALKAAGHDVRGGIAEIFGHTYACQACQEALYKAGVLWIGVRP